MKKVNNLRFQEMYYEETLENGLKVILWEKKGYKKSFFMMATPLGALDIIQIDEQGREYKFPSGIAHFLEHKMFEKKQSDVMEEFTQMGANCNAFTSYNETVYYFSTAEHPQKPLQLLLDFVQELSISDESVEKEKGIIIQELEMYQQMSESRIINETMDALYSFHPLKYDIGGTNISVSNTTKNQLEQCYSLNYHPSKMVLVGVSGENCLKLMEFIKKNQKNKSFPLVNKVERKICEEPFHVNEKERTIFMDITIPKVCLAFKCKGIKDSKKRNREEWCYKLLFDLCFSSINPLYQTWIDGKIINQTFNFEIDFGDDYGYIYFYSETQFKDQFVNTILESLNNIHEIDDKALQQLKRRYFGNSIMALQNMKQIAITCVRCYFSNQDFFSSLIELENIDKKELLDALYKMDFNNHTIVQILPNRK